MLMAKKNISVSVEGNKSAIKKMNVTVGSIDLQIKLSKHSYVNN